jgi:hypothetical protein
MLVKPLSLPSTTYIIEPIMGADQDKVYKNYNFSFTGGDGLV